MQEQVNQQGMIPAVTQDRNLDPYNSLEKLIRLDRKHSNFEYIDRFLNMNFRVNYPPLYNASPGQHLLKSFWRHVCSYYFKKIEVQELNRLNYFNLLIEPTIAINTAFNAQPQFWLLLQNTFSSTYLHRYNKSKINQLDYHNWLCTLYLLWQQLVTHHKSNQNNFIEIQNCLNFLIDHKQNQKRYLNNLHSQKQAINRLLPQVEIQNDEISLEIGQLENLLKNNNKNNCQLLNALQTSVQQQLSLQSSQCGESVCIINSTEDFINYKAKIPQSPYDLIKLRKESLQSITLQLQYLQYIVVQLEKKQIAQSITKILKVQKGCKNQIKFQATFQSSMSLTPILVSEKQIIQLNQLRQYSLLKFYNTSLKSPYSFICQNFYGFKDIYQNRLQSCKLKLQNIFQLIKRTAGNHQSLSTIKSTKQFSKNFDICHHCKLLYPNNFLICCQYNSNKNGIPAPLLAYYDPYLAQINKNQPRINLQSDHKKFQNKLRDNCYISYMRVNEQYLCNRKFCFHCIRQNHYTFDKHDLCPFCQGCCYCTRCTRSDMIVRLKSMFVLLGGDIDRIQRESYLYEFLTRNNKGNNNSKNVNTNLSPNSKRNNNHYMNGNSSNNACQNFKKYYDGNKSVRKLPIILQKTHDKMHNIRFQLQQLRLICDVVKRRQKLKYKLIECQMQSFHHQINLTRKNFHPKIQIKNDDNQEIKQMQKLKKKLHRMI